MPRKEANYKQPQLNGKGRQGAHLIETAAQYKHQQHVVTEVRAKEVMAARQPKLGRLVHHRQHVRLNFPLERRGWRGDQCHQQTNVLVGCGKITRLKASNKHSFFAQDARSLECPKGFWQHVCNQVPHTAPSVVFERKVGASRKQNQRYLYI
jgi:hypothetical protein